MTKPTSQQSSPEFRERAFRMVQEHPGVYETQWAAIRSMGEEIGCSAEALRTWLRRVSDALGRRVRDRGRVEAVRRTG